MGSPFLKIGVTLAILSLSGKIPVFNTCFITIVNDFMIAGSIIFKNFEEIPSNPQLCFVGKFYIIFFTASSSILFILKDECICLFR